MYSILEEKWNFISHLAGVILSVIGFTYLLMVAFTFKNILQIVSILIFGFSAITLYSNSSLYHYFRFPMLKKFFQLLDHSSIYILIAGTYTPVTLLVMSQPLGVILFSIVWLLAVGGIFLEFAFRTQNKLISLSLYFAMGWMAIFFSTPLLENFSAFGIVALFTGGIFYSVGAIFYVAKKIPFNHAIWHFFVLFGTFSHFFMVHSIIA